ncbi:hypothetical protein VAR608DRAFT_6742 [Variovorax sp. HW608]|nr:hypothetical protein VAR608DRAFT_6742 [Variovorax sp. HW608]
MPHGLGRFLLRPAVAPPASSNSYTGFSSRLTERVRAPMQRNKVNPPSQIATSRGSCHDQVLQLVSYGEPRSREVLPRLRRQVLRHSDARLLCVRRFARRAAAHIAGAAQDRDPAAGHRTRRHGGMAVDRRDLDAHPPRAHDDQSPAKAPNHPCGTVGGAGRGDGDRDHQPADAQSGGPHGRVDDAQQRAPDAAAPESRGAGHRPTRHADRGDTHAAAGCRDASDPDARGACGRSADGPLRHERREGAPVARDEPGGPGAFGRTGTRRPRGAATSAAGQA